MTILNQLRRDISVDKSMNKMTISSALQRAHAAGSESDFHYVSVIAALASRDTALARRLRATLPQGSNATRSQAAKQLAEQLRAIGYSEANISAVVLPRLDIPSMTALSNAIASVSADERSELVAAYLNEPLLNEASSGNAIVVPVDTGRPSESLGAYGINRPARTRDGSIRMTRSNQEYENARMNQESTDDATLGQQSRQAGEQQTAYTRLKQYTGQRLSSIGRNVYAGLTPKNVLKAGLVVGAAAIGASLAARALPATGVRGIPTAARTMASEIPSSPNIYDAGMRAWIGQPTPEVQQPLDQAGFIASTRMTRPPQPPGTPMAESTGRSPIEMSRFSGSENLRATPLPRQAGSNTSTQMTRPSGRIPGSSSMSELADIARQMRSERPPIVSFSDTMKRMLAGRSARGDVFGQIPPDTTAAIVGRARAMGADIAGTDLGGFSNALATLGAQQRTQTLQPQTPNPSRVVRELSAARNARATADAASIIGSRTSGFLKRKQLARTPTEIRSEIRQGKRPAVQTEIGELVKGPSKSESLTAGNVEGISSVAGTTTKLVRNFEELIRDSQVSEGFQRGFIEDNELLKTGAPGTGFGRRGQTPKKQLRTKLLGKSSTLKRLVGAKNASIADVDAGIAFADKVRSGLSGNTQFIRDVDKIDNELKAKRARLLKAKEVRILTPKSSKGKGLFAKKGEGLFNSKSSMRKGEGLFSKKGEGLFNSKSSILRGGGVPGGIPEMMNDDAKHIKYQLNLMLGLIGAGNDSKNIVNKALDLVGLAFDKGVISKTKALKISKSIVG